MRRSLLVILVGSGPVARVKVAMPSETSLENAIIAGAITHGEIDGKLVPAIRDGAMIVVMRDCTMLANPPSCGCASASSGKTYVSLYDSNHDCAISLDEVRNNSLMMSLLGTDVTVEGMPGLSVGLGASAVRAGFVAPQ